MSENAEEVGPGRVNRTVVLSGIGLAIVSIAGIVGVLWFVESERQRDLQSWQIRMGIVADSRAAAVNEWLEVQFLTLRELAENASLQLYMTELSLSEGDRSGITDEPA